MEENTTGYLVGDRIMASDAILLVQKDKRLPNSLAGDTGKLVAVNSAENSYEHVSPGSRLTGEVIMWVTNTPPTGYLSCDGLEYLIASYPTLAAILGTSSPGKFRTPAINFPKNSVGVNTLVAQAESVGTHGHTASGVADHTHTGTASSQGAHSHSVYCRSDSTSTMFNQGNNYGNGLGGRDTSSDGAHTHTVSIAGGGGHTPSITNHTGINQPACTLLHFCIKT